MKEIVSFLQAIISFYTSKTTHYSFYLGQIANPQSLGKAGVIRETHNLAYIAKMYIFTLKKYDMFVCMYVCMSVHFVRINCVTNSWRTVEKS